MKRSPETVFCRIGNWLEHKLDKIAINPAASEEILQEKVFHSGEFRQVWAVNKTGAVAGKFERVA